MSDLKITNNLVSEKQIPKDTQRTTYEDKENFLFSIDNSNNDLGSPYKKTNIDDIPDTPEGDWDLYDDLDDENAESVVLGTQTSMGKNVKNDKNIKDEGITGATVSRGEITGEKTTIDRTDLEKIVITKTIIRDNKFIINPDDPENSLSFDITDEEAKFLTGKSPKQLNTPEMLDFIETLKLSDSIQLNSFISKRSVDNALTNRKNVIDKTTASITNATTEELKYTSDALIQLYKNGTLPEGYEWNDKEEANVKHLTANQIHAVLGDITPSDNPKKQYMGDISPSDSPQKQFIAKTTYEVMIKSIENRLKQTPDGPAKKMLNAQLSAYKKGYEKSGLKEQSFLEKKLNAFKDVAPKILESICILNPKLGDKMKYCAVVANAFVDTPNQANIQVMADYLEKAKLSELDKLREEQQIAEAKASIAEAQRRESDAKKPTDDELENKQREAELSEAELRRDRANKEREELNNPQARSTEFFEESEMGVE